MWISASGLDGPSRKEGKQDSNPQKPLTQILASIDLERLERFGREVEPEIRICPERQCWITKARTQKSWSSFPSPVFWWLKPARFFKERTRDVEDLAATMTLMFENDQVAIVDEQLKLLSWKKLSLEWIKLICKIFILNATLWSKSSLTFLTPILPSSGLKISVKKKTHTPPGEQDFKSWSFGNHSSYGDALDRIFRSTAAITVDHLVSSPRGGTVGIS